MGWNRLGRQNYHKMKYFYVCLLSCLFINAASAVPAVVDYIFDGDTFAAFVLLQDDTKISVRVRLKNVDTPELKGSCDKEIRMANRAKDRLAELLPVGEVVELQNIKDDKYLGRIDADVILQDGRDVGNILLQEKLGRSYNGGKRESWCN